MTLRWFFILSLLISLTSCIEIIDDLSLNEDGSGTFKYNINLSSSKVKINSLLALDSLDGKRVPSLEEISEKFNNVVDLLRTKEGISEVTFSADYNNYIFKLKCDFSSLSALQNAIHEVIKSENGNKSLPELEETWLTFEEDKLVRSIPQITVQKAKEINTEDRALLKNGSYTSITRFYKEVDQCENDRCVVSKNRMAVMLRTDPYSLTQNPNLLDNAIYLVASN